MSDEPTERDVEALAASVCPCGNPALHNPNESTECAWALDLVGFVLASDWYAERIAEARREGAAEALAPVDETLDGMAARPPYDLNDALRRLLTLRAALRDTP